MPNYFIIGTYRYPHNNIVDKKLLRINEPISRCHFKIMYNIMKDLQIPGSVYPCHLKGYLNNRKKSVIDKIGLLYSIFPIFPSIFFSNSFTIYNPKPEPPLVRDLSTV